MPMVISKQNKFRNVFTVLSVSLIMSTYTIYTYTRLLRNSYGSDYHESSCVKLINNYSDFPVSEQPLFNIIRTCKKNGQLQERLVFDDLFLGNNLKNYVCDCTTRRWLDMELTALASFPGSGNTFTRILFKAVTGMETVLPGARQCPVDVGTNLVKTHGNDSLIQAYCRVKNRTQNSEIYYRKAVYIIRNPFYAVLAEFKRKHGGSPTSAPKLNQDIFTTTKWNVLVTRSSERWKEMTLFWTTLFQRPVYIVFYEKLEKYTMIEMFNLLKFMEIKVDFRSLYCVAASCVANTIRQSPSWLDNMTLYNIYNTFQKEKINAIIREVAEKTKLKYVLRYVL